MNAFWWLFTLVGLIYWTLPTQVDSAKILAVAFFSGKSHKIVYEPLLYELAKRGHEVTIVTPVPVDPKKKGVKNVREILTIDYLEIIKDSPNMFELKEKNENVNFFAFFEKIEKLCRDTYDLPQIKSLMNEKFDLIISQPFFNECVMGFVHHFNTSLALISLGPAPPQISWITGTPSPMSFTPQFFLPYSQKMTFYQRMVNAAITLLVDGLHQFYFKPKATALYREKLGDPNIPSVDEVLINASLILSNGHISLNPPKPFLPDIVEVGGMHCRPAQPLPKDLEEFVNSTGNDGFIYFSMGSVIQAHTMPEKTRKVLLKVFSQLKQKVLWKWETEDMPDLPKNVKLGKWLPQQDILGHSKIRLFITHGGLGSTTETVYHGTPLLGIPMFGDQNMNMQKSVDAGFALNLDFNDITEESLLATINRLLNEPSFNEKAKSLSKIFRDQPDKPLDRGVFWVEYILRHGGAVHLRSAARDLNFFQYHSFDVIGAYAAIIFLIFYIVFALCRCVLRKVCGSSRKSTSTISSTDSRKKRN